MERKTASKRSGTRKKAGVPQEPQKPSRRAHRTAQRRSRIVGWIVAAFVAVSLAIAAYFGLSFTWNAWLSDVPAAAAQEKALGDFEQKQANKQATKTVASTDKTKASDKAPVYSMTNLPAVKDVNTGEVYGKMRIPAFGADWEKPLIEGNQNDWNANNALLDTLGIVHYQSTSQPGEAGNFAVAGHRNGHGSVFTDIQILKKGDSVEVETLEGTFIYSVVDAGWTIDPSDNSVLDSNPLGKEKNTKKKLLTLTTCGWWNDQERVVVVAELTGFKAS